MSVLRLAQQVCGHLQPVNLSIMSKAEDELVDDSINAHSPTDQFQSGIFWVVKDEVVTVKVRQFRSPDTAGKRRDMIHIGFLDHSRHGLFDRSLAELIQAVFFPDFLKIEVGPTENRFQETERACM